MLTLLLACTGPADTDAPPADPSVDWRPGLPALTQGLRTITHLHSPWSHDACDGNGIIDGVANQPCLDDFRRGLCDAGIDVAFTTDHPSYGAFQTFDDLFHPRPGDVRDGAVAVLTCDDGREVRLQPGFEDELMPVGLDQHVPGTADERDDLLNRSDPDAMAAMIGAGAHVFVAHTEGRDLQQLRDHQDAGLTGVEIFNLHAMFAPDIRAEDLGLDGLGWVQDIRPFTDPDATGEPDLFVLGVLQSQPPSLERFDDLLARGPIVGIVGTDAHQNVLPIDLRDGERADSYRRMLRWMDNVVLPEAGQTVEDALAAGQSYVAFEILGTPDGFDFRAEDGTGLGGETSATQLTITCPTLHPDSPRGPEEPELHVRLVRGQAVVAEGCGTHEVDGAGAYRVEIDIVPHHLTRFLGDTPEDWLVPFPWILSNAIHVR
ncbi:MAG: hypothetical protein R3F61_09540 [Myxococcota bacterium]